MATKRKSTKKTNLISNESLKNEVSQDQVETELEELEKTNLFEMDVQLVAKRIASQAVPLKELKELIEEFSAEEKRSFCQRLIKGVPLSKSKDFTSSKIITLLRPKNLNAELRYEIYLYLFIIVREMFREHRDIMEIASLLENEAMLREKYGDWHYYFALFLWPVLHEDVKKRAGELREELLELASTSDKESNTDQTLATSTLQVSNSKKEKLISQERNLRIELQEKNDKLKSELAKQQQLYEEALNSIAQLSQAKSSLEADLSELKNKYDELNRNHQELTRAHQKVVREHDELNREYSEMNHIFEQAAAAASERIEQEEEVDYPVEANEAQPSQSPISSNSSYMPSYSLSEWHDLYYNAMKEEVNHIFQLSLQDMSFLEQPNERDRIKDYFDMLGILEGFKPKLSNVKPITFTIESDKELDNQDDSHLFFDAIAEQGESKHLPDEIIGKFCRESLGGFIELEDEGKIFVPETIVNTVAIEHNALVKGIRGSNGHYRYTVLLQGDNAQSEVTQIMGYVEEDDDYSFRCVDVNSKQSYPIHYRDAEYWEIADGDTGIFNIASGESVVRISRIYEEQHQASSFAINKSITRNKDTQQQENIEDHFLEGCKIVIVGGVKRWFSETIEKTGAELIHNSGSNPSRVYPDIRTADAVFLLLSANSHNATWGAVETAKRYNVPYFTIKGSRSNLLNLLREKQDIILRRHHGSLIQ